MRGPIGQRVNLMGFQFRKLGLELQASTAAHCMHYSHAEKTSIAIFFCLPPIVSAQPAYRCHDAITHKPPICAVATAGVYRTGKRDQHASGPSLLSAWLCGSD